MGGFSTKLLFTALAFALLAIMSVKGQSATIYKTGYIFYKSEDGSPVQFFFVEKNILKNVNAENIHSVFDSRLDTAVQLTLTHLKNRRTIDTVFSQFLNISLWAQIVIYEDGKANTYKYDMRLLPVELEVMLMDVEFSSMPMDDFDYPIFLGDKPVIRNCKHETYEFGVVRNVKAIQLNQPGE